jgi:predicted ATPase/class 3 adenylate cyclase/Tfp pilus assembly protein PilF
MSDVRALLLTDVIDSTKLSEKLGDDASAALWAAHDRVARDLLGAYKGREIDKTDGFLLLFDSATDAARYAFAYHRAIADLDVPLRARAGGHVGPVILRENNPSDVALGAKPLEVEGLAKPLAARIMGLSDAGRTLFSAAAAEAIDQAAFEGHVLHHHGHYRFKGIEEPLEIAELAAPFAACPPPADTEKAYRVMRVGEFWRPVREVRHNLVPERDTFVGRQAELHDLARCLEGETRLLTVLGPGGTGKTRLVRRYAMAWLGEWPGGVYFCDLSEARSLEGIYAVVAFALGVPLGKEDAGVQLGHAIAGRGRCLVILDNFEQVASYAATTVGHWLNRAAQASFLVTSRERLRLEGEQVTALDPMDPAGDAIELFEVRARLQQPGFAINAANRASVAEIVQLLDGLPLAIELAAARVRVLSLAQIVLRMKDRFVLLTGARGAAARQATLKAAIDWSWELLTPSEQAALAQCAMFDGGFTLEAAEAVVSLRTWTEALPVLDAIHSLVDKSLLRTWLPKTARHLEIAEPFFGMYLSIREYARQKLDTFGEQVVSDVVQRHGRYFAGFGSDEARDALLKHGGIAKRQKLTEELDNLISACRHAIRRQQPEVAAACFLAAFAVLEARGPFGLAATLGRDVAAIPGMAPPLSAQVRVATADALRAAGEIGQSDSALAEALSDARQSQDPRTEAFVLRHLATACHRQGEINEASRHFDTARVLYENLNDRAQLGALLANLANLQMELGHMTEARESYQAALGLHREIGNRAAEGIALGNLGTLHHELGHAADARAAYDAALLIHREAGSLLQEAITLGNLGLLVNEQGAPGAAAKHYDAALRIHKEIGNRRGEGVVLGQIGELHQKLGDFEQAKAHYDEALRIHREVGNRRFEGSVLSRLGELLARQHQVEPALRALEAGERLLRDVHDSLDLGKLLCIKGSVALACGDSAVARSALAEAEAISAKLGAEPASELGQKITALRHALG